LFGELGYLNGQRGEGPPENRCGATPLVDATIRFFEEFLFNEKESPPTQLPPREATRGKSREDEEGKGGNKVMGSFEPTYMYDAMKEKRQLKRLLVRSRATYDSAPLLLISLPTVHRMANSKTQKSFSASTLTLLMKSCPSQS
jgi:hypothetical protein